MIADPLVDEDLQLSLYLCYELHYRGLPGVDDRWEWEPTLLALRAGLEAQFEAALREAVAQPAARVAASEIDLALREIAERDGPPLSQFVRTQATIEQVREFLVHRSAYQLKEADPHSWAIPRLWGRTEGGDDRDPGRRVRRRARRVDARRAVRSGDGCCRPGLRATGRTSTRFPG